MAELVKCFDWSKHEVVSVIGSGGKSSLIVYLARAFSHERVLISTTTKILMPEKEEYHILWLNPCCQDEQGVIPPGIVIAGDEILTDGISKLQMPKGAEFIKSFEGFDKVFLESDGSRGLPLKGWADSEPVVLPETTMTIGIIPISAIGKLATKEVVHRLPLWLALTKKEERTLLSGGNEDVEKGRVAGDENQGFVISKENIIQTITHEKGLWKKSKGDKILYMSQVETQQQLELARGIVEDLPDDFKGKISRIIAGSVQNKKGTILYQKNK